MPESLPTQIGWLFTLVVAGLAWWRGGHPERLGASLMVIAGVAVPIAHHLLPTSKASVALLMIDAAMAAGFLGLAIRYASLWLGAAMLLQAMQFSLHAFYIVIEKAHDRLYSIINNLDTIGVILCVLVGTLIAWRRRNRDARRLAQAV